MYGQIEKLQAERDLRLLQISVVSANPGKKGEAFKKLDDSLRKAASRNVYRASTITPNVTPLTSFAEDGEIEEIRRKQYEANLRIEAEKRKQNADQ